jgi:hypothetical protein
MRFRERFLILFIAVVMTILGFNLIALDAVHLVQEASATGHEYIDSYVIELDVNIHQIP